MIKTEIRPEQGEVILHFDEKGRKVLENALRDAERGAKVLIGDPGAMLILRPEGWT